MTAAVPHVTVASLLRARLEVLNVGLELVAGGNGLERRITSPRVQKTGLALAGFDVYLQPGRVLIFGQSEISYLRSLPSDSRRASLSRAFSHPIPCVLVTGGQRIPEEVAEEAERMAVPVIGTPQATPVVITKLEGFLEDILAERTIVHAVLIDILGLGVLVTGESGIGKSECALDLILRGHRLVADDTVEVRRRAESVLIGTCPALTRHHMEIRGLGLINVRDLFGVASTRTSKRVELVVRLERWEPGREYERLGLDDQFDEVLGIRIPLITMPVAPGRSVANLVEVAARNQLLRSRGHHAARTLVARLDHQLSQADDALHDPDESPDDHEQEDA
jgi:HPr kinase/phosphorylase